MLCKGAEGRPSAWVGTEVCYNPPAERVEGCMCGKVFAVVVGCAVVNGELPSSREVQGQQLLKISRVVWAGSLTGGSGVRGLYTTVNKSSASHLSISSNFSLQPLADVLTPVNLFFCSLSRLALPPSLPTWHGGNQPHAA